MAPSKFNRVQKTYWATFIRLSTWSWMRVGTATCRGVVVFFSNNDLPPPPPRVQEATHAEVGAGDKADYPKVRGRLSQSVRSHQFGGAVH